MPNVQGLPYFYAVFANRDGVISKESAVLDQPVVLVRMECQNVMMQQKSWKHGSQNFRNTDAPE